MSLQLKIKSKHLGEEARIIRFEENKLKKRALSAKTEDKKNEYISSLSNIQYHRKWDVRNENRATFLARAYIAGKPYKYAEPKRKDDIRFVINILPRVLAMVQKYGSYDMRKTTMDQLKNWSNQE